MTSFDPYGSHEDPIPRVIRVLVDIEGKPIVLLDNAPEALVEDAKELVQKMCSEIQRERDLPDFLHFTNDDYYGLIRAVKDRLKDHVNSGRLFRAKGGWTFDPNASVIAVDFKSKQRVKV